jgi:transposase
MASLQTLRVKGNTYYRLVTCRRINGKPTPVVLAYLGKADDIQKRLAGADEARVRSWSHGAVAALYALARELQLAELIDRHLSNSGRRMRTSCKKPAPIPPQMNDGLSVGQSLTLVAIGRACYATSKRAFAEWAKTTTLGELAGVEVQRLTSQHFWDQMDQLPVELIEPIERELVSDVVQRFELPLDTLLFDATNFFTFIASDNERCELPARGKQKQKRNDLGQVGVALLCSRQHGIPLWHRTYGGNVADATCFSEALSSLKQRVLELRRDKQRRNRARIERDIENYLKGRQHLGEVIRFKLAGEDPHLTVSYEFDQAAFDALAQGTFGRLVLMTDRHNWSTAEIIRAYHGQSAVEAAFAHLKDPMHLALRPQRHWTDQKLHVHVFTCVLGFLLASLLHLRARRANAPYASMESLIEALGRVRRVMIVRRSAARTGKPSERTTYQLEEIEPEMAPLLPILGVPG